MWTVYRLFTEQGEYFGITSNLPKRLAKHRSPYNTGSHKYYGFEILKTDLTYEDAKMIENLLITSLPCINPYKSGFTSKDRKEYNHLYFNNLREGEMMMFGKTNCWLFRRMFK